MYFAMAVGMREYSFVMAITKMGTMDLLVLLGSLCVGIDTDSTFISCLIELCFAIWEVCVVVDVVRGTNHQYKYQLYPCLIK